MALVIPEDQLASLVGELKKGLEESGARSCAARVISTLAASRPIGDHVESLLQALVGLMSEDDPEVLQTCWTALQSVASTVPKEMRPTYIRSNHLDMTPEQAVACLGY